MLWCIVTGTCISKISSDEEARSSSKETTTSPSPSPPPHAVANMLQQQQQQQQQQTAPPSVEDLLHFMAQQSEAICTLQQQLIAQNVPKPQVVVLS